MKWGREQEENAIISGLKAKLNEYDDQRDEYWRVIGRLNDEIIALKAERDSLTVKVADLERLTADGDERIQIRAAARSDALREFAEDFALITDRFKRFPDEVMDHVLAVPC